MKKNLELYLKGMAVGLGFIIPGVSGGALSVILGIYENLVEAASNFYKSIDEFKKHFKFLFPFGLGVLTSAIIFAKIIEFSLNKAPIITILLFLGLIIGGIPSLFKSVDNNHNLKDYSLCLIGVIICLLLIILNKQNGNVSFTNMNFTNYLLLFLVGILSSATVVIPGISGSFTLMIVGYYEPLLKLVNEITSFTNLQTNIIIFGVFGLGMFLGVIIISKIINYFLKHYNRQTYFVIFGFVIASVISVIYELFSYEFNLLHLIIGIILLVINTIISYKVFDK